MPGGCLIASPRFDDRPCSGWDGIVMWSLRQLTACQSQHPRGVGFVNQFHGEHKPMINNPQYKWNYLPGKRLITILFMTSLVAVLVLALTGGGSISASAAGTSVIIVGAGDISSCSNTNDSKTAQLLGLMPPSVVFTLGDNVYNSGTSDQYTNCYNPTWGAYKSITKPVPGNHEYQTSGATGYYNYFGVPKYYAYDAGEWRIYALNSEIDASATSAQAQWLKQDLAANPKMCVMAYWHRSRWSSGRDHGNDSKSQTLWTILYNANAELVLTGHNHNYERFDPMNKNGQAVSTGLQEFVVGTGGVGHDGFGTVLSASRARNSDTYGVLRLYLQPDRYSWRFLPISGQTYSDTGTILCH
jgi:acid phosphatase type 7